MDIKQAAAAYGNMAGIMQNQPADDAGTTQKPGDPSFSDLVGIALGNAVDSGHKAEKISTLALLGKADLVQVVTAVGEAENALNMVVAIRDKVISAYQQISQMPI